jgi:RND family efflux transporter MFP subunit
MFPHPSTLIAAGLLSLMLEACGGSTAIEDPRNQPLLVKAATVQQASDSSRSFSGVVAARVQAELSFRVSGKVLERLVDTGQTVKRGQPLMRLDPIDLGLQAQVQQQSVAAAHALARQTALEETRYRDLIDTGAVSVSAYEQIKAAAATAKANLSAAEAQAMVSSHASGYSTLVADADGVVVQTLAEPGQVVSAGQPVVRLAQAGQREAIIHLPETLRPNVGSVAQATQYGNPIAPVRATLRLLSDAADPVTRTFEARYVLEGDLSSAPLGATVTLQITAGPTPTRSLQIPIAAVYDFGKGTGVWVIAGTPATVTWRPVQLQGLGYELAKVTGNLQPGEQIVALGAQLLRDGEKVRLTQQDSVEERL